MTSSVFISHSHLDNSWCDSFTQNLAKQYDVNVWYDQAGLFAGDEWVPTLEREIEQREIYMIILTPESWGSRWVQKEYQLALGLHKRIVGVMHKRVQLSGFITTYQVVDCVGLAGDAAAQRIGSDLKLIRLKATQEATPVPQIVTPPRHDVSPPARRERPITPTPSSLPPAPLHKTAPTPPRRSPRIMLLGGAVILTLLATLLIVRNHLGGSSSRASLTPVPQFPTGAFLTAASFTSPNEGWAVGYGGTILHYQHGSWSNFPSTVTTALSGITMFSPQEGWAIGDGGTVLHFVNGSWKSTTFSDAYVLSIAFVSAKEGWILGRPQSGPFSGFPGVAFHYQGNWTQLADTRVLQPMYAISMLSSSDGWAAGAGSFIFHYTNGHWNAATPAGTFGNVFASDSLFGIKMLSPTEGWVVGDNGIIGHFANNQWQTVSPSPTRQSLKSIAMVSANEGWAVGYNGTIVHYTSGVWGVIKSPTTANLNSVVMVSPTEGWAVGNKVILHYVNGKWSI